MVYFKFNHDSYSALCVSLGFVCVHIEFENSPSVLNPKFAFYLELFLEFNKSSEFRLQIFHIELVILKSHFCVTSGNRNISNSDFALMTSPKLQWLAFFWRDHV